MSDRRPSKLSGGDVGAAVAAMPRWMHEAIDEHVGVPKDVVSVILDAVDPIAVVRRGVESGTIEGEVEWWCVPWENQWGVHEPCEAGSDHDGDAGCHWRLVIPVSDGGSET